MRKPGLRFSLEFPVRQSAGGKCLCPSVSVERSGWLNSLTPEAMSLYGPEFKTLGLHNSG